MQLKSQWESRRRGREDRFEFRLKRQIELQTSLNISNEAGAAWRSDSNNAWQTLASLNSGTAAPGTMYAYMLWADTTNGLLKQRNAANSAWLVRGTLAETFVIARSSNTILGVGDIARMFKATSTFTQTLTAAATLGDGWFVDYRNDGTGVITLDPNSAETIDGFTTLNLYPGESCRIWCDGSNFKTVGRSTIAILAKSAVAVAAPADTTEDILATITIPANAMGANGAVRIRAFFTNNNNGNNKTARIRYSGIGGTVLSGTVNTTSTSLYFDFMIQNRNATNSQTSSGFLISQPSTVLSASGATTTAVDTTASSTIVLTGQKAVAGDTIQLESYTVEIMQG